MSRLVLKKHFLNKSVFYNKTFVVQCTVQHRDSPTCFHSAKINWLSSVQRGHLLEGFPFLCVIAVFKTPWTWKKETSLICKSKHQDPEIIWCFCNSTEIRAKIFLIIGLKPTAGDAYPLLWGIQSLHQPWASLKTSLERNWTQTKEQWRESSASIARLKMGEWKHKVAADQAG